MHTTSPGSDPSALVEHFFNEFDEAFRSFDGVTIAERYAEPYLACGDDGTAQVFATRADTAQYFQQVLDGYFAQGVRSCRHRNVQVVALGTNYCVGTVTWDLTDEAANVVVS